MWQNFPVVKVKHKKATLNQYVTDTLLRSIELCVDYLDLDPL